ncbi:MAG TPA: hypothetical protein VGM20_01695 [Gemmatimonadales bacterium]
MTNTLKAPRIVRELPDGLQLAAGGHADHKSFCFNEAVAFVAGEKWSDAPACVSPVIRRFGMGLNDRWSDADRQLLVPFIPRVIGTRTTDADELTRKFMALDWAYRTAAPAAFRLLKLDEQAERLATIAPIVDQATWDLAWPVMRQLRDKAWERRAAALEKIRAIVKPAEVAAAVAAVAAEVEAEAEAEAVAEAVAAAVAAAAAAAISRILGDESAENSLLRRELVEIIRKGAASLPKNPSWGQAWEAVYWPVRHKIRELIGTPGVFGPAYEAHRVWVRDSALDLLDRMIAVGRVEPTIAIKKGAQA